MTREVAPVSVIVPAYNAVSSIVRALRSIAEQTLLPSEVIVVDDGSSDGTAEVAEKQRRILDPVRLIVARQENAGAGAARNRAIAEASEAYLAFLDADDEWLPRKLESSMAEFAHRDYVLVAHDYLDARGTIEQHIDCRRHFLDGDPYASLYLKGYIPSISVVVKRQSVLNVGGFDETLYNAQDFDLWLKLLAPPESEFTVIGDALARYHHTPGSIMSHTERRISCCKIIAQRYRSPLEIRRLPVDRLHRKRLVYIYLEAIRAKVSLTFGYTACALRDIVFLERGP